MEEGKCAVTGSARRPCDGKVLCLDYGGGYMNLHMGNLTWVKLHRNCIELHTYTHK